MPRYVSKKITLANKTPCVYLKKGFSCTLALQEVIFYLFYSCVTFSLFNFTLRMLRGRVQVERGFV